MNTRRPPQELAVDLCFRSTCRIRMAAVISDRQGRILAWGWNAAGPSGFGTHAEEHAITRANRRRLVGATITVAGVKNGTRDHYVFARPCEERCLPLIRRMGITTIQFVTPDGWKAFRVR